MAEFKTGEVLKMLAQAGKRPNNRLVVKLTGLLLMDKPWVTKEGETRHNYTLFAESSQALVEFSSTRLLTPGKPCEVLLTLDGFRAFGSVPAPKP